MKRHNPVQILRSATILCHGAFLGSFHALAPVFCTRFPELAVFPGFLCSASVLPLLVS